MTVVTVAVAVVNIEMVLVAVAVTVEVGYYCWRLLNKVAAAVALTVVQLNTIVAAVLSKLNGNCCCNNHQRLK